jgi:hypothetical protein
MAAVIIGAVEVTVEFMASAAAPSITLLVMKGRPLTPATLTCMAMYAYTFSSAFGAVAYTTMILANVSRPSGNVRKKQGNVQQCPGNIQGTFREISRDHTPTPSASAFRAVAYTTTIFANSFRCSECDEM